MEYVLGLWDALPRYEFVDLTDDVRETLRSYRDQSGVGPSALLRGSRKESPDGLNASIVQGWCDGKGRKARRDHLDYVLARWQSLIEDGRERIPVTAEHLARLQRDRRRTGVEPAELIKAAENPPDGLSVVLLHQWISGKVGTARKDHLDFVLERWGGLPDFDASPISDLGIGRHELRRGRVVMTDDIRTHLHMLQLRSGKGPYALLTWAKNEHLTVPRGLTHSGMEGWFKQSVKSVDPVHLAFAVKAWNALCVDDNEIVDLWEEDRAALRRYRSAGLLPSAIFCEARGVPDGLAVQTVNLWLSGKVRQARRDYLEWVWARCAALTVSETRRVAVTYEIRLTLEIQRQRSGVGQTDLLRHDEDVPDGLSAATITAWINGRVGTARKDYLVVKIKRVSPSGSADFRHAFADARVSSV
ncbi:hypothetical protein BAL199_21394 [alpha proteobacterium BAL199]|nr:hypothetical protein BAL199_21394 [alpha proteobacterium BAL199]